MVCCARVMVVLLCLLVFESASCSWFERELSGKV